MENNQSNEINNLIYDSFKRLIESNRINIEDIKILSSYGIVSGLLILSEILKSIEENGLKSAGKIYHSRYMEMFYLHLNTEYEFRTRHFFENGYGFVIPNKLQEAFMNLKLVVQKLDLEMTYELNELNKSINQKELSYLFAALAKMNYFRSNTTLLADALGLITGYSENSIIRVIQSFNSTNGGLSDIEKQNLLKSKMNY